MDRPDVFFFSAFASRPRPSTADLLESVDGHPERERARDLLAARRPADLSVEELRDILGGNLFLLKPAAFLHFLPAILTAIIADYPALTVITSELLGLLTPPTRDDMADRHDQVRGRSGLPDETAETLRSLTSQLIDSGILAERFAARFDGVSQEEGRAIMKFLCLLRDQYGADFPDGAIDKAIAHWAIYP
jgi:hypothetical protein